MCHGVIQLIKHFKLQFILLYFILKYAVKLILQKQMEYKVLKITVYKATYVAFGPFDSLCVSS